MTIAFPVPQWPTSLLEAGPPEDPSILLRAEALIGGTRFTLTAVRVDPIRYGPDFRPDQGREIYAAYGLAVMLDNLAALIEVEETATIRLATGNYMMWMFPNEAEE